MIDTYSKMNNFWKIPAKIAHQFSILKKDIFLFIFSPLMCYFEAVNLNILGIFE